MNGEVHTAEEERHHDGAEHADNHDRGEVEGEVPGGSPASCGYQDGGGEEGVLVHVHKDENQLQTLHEGANQCSKPFLDCKFVSQIGDNFCVET